MPSISRDDYLKALALVTSANDLYVQATQFDMALQRLLGLECRHFGEGRLGEIIYDDNRVTVAAFERALKDDGFEVAPSNPGNERDGDG